MNKVVMMGRLVGDPKISYSKNGNAMAIARYRLAVARKSKKQGEAAADFLAVSFLAKVLNLRSGIYTKEPRSVFRGGCRQAVMSTMKTRRSRQRRSW